MQKILIAMLLSAGCAFQSAQAGILEDLLAVPAIQSLLGRLPELPIISRNCADPTFKQRNATFCQQVDDAARLAQMPTELRLLMAQPRAAASLRELCLAAVGRPMQNTYLCNELYKAESGFNSMAEQRRKLLQEQNRESPG
jgi:hypothetical protein